MWQDASMYLSGTYYVDTGLVDGGPHDERWPYVMDLLNIIIEPNPNHYKSIQKSTNRTEPIYYLPLHIDPIEPNRTQSNRIILH